MKASRLRIIVTGLIAQHPTLGGVAWDYLQYVIGLHRLGHDVFYVEDSGEWPYVLTCGPDGGDCIARDPSANIAHLSAALSRYGLGDHWAYRFPITGHWFGMPDKRRREVIKSADLLINVSGTLAQPWHYRRIPRLVYIDSDPGFTQAKLQLQRGQKRFQRRFAAHDAYFSFGEQMAKSDASGRWAPTRQPILLDEWHSATPTREVYTTVMSWTSYPPLTLDGRRYGQKDLELLRFIDLPVLSPSVSFEVALGGSDHLRWESRRRNLPESAAAWLREHPRARPSELLTAAGWQITDPGSVCGSIDSYRHYIESSKAEWSIAKNGYVVSHSGWFSCRSACYLAAGRPVLVQDTGFTIPRGQGVLAFSTPEEAVAGIQDIETNYRRHSHAAREIAEEYFDSDKVLGRLIENAFSVRHLQRTAA